MFRESSINLDKTIRITGKISSRKIAKYFSFTLTNSPIDYNVYRASRDYDDLQNTLTVGDTVVVYAVNSATANLQVGQVEKNGQIIVSKQLLEGQNMTSGFIGLLGGIMMASIGIWQFKRNKILR